MKAPPPDRPPPADRSNHADRRPARPPRERRSGEGAASALASLKTIELAREKAKPPQDDGTGG